MIWQYPQDFKKIFYKPGETAEYVYGKGILMARVSVHSETDGSIHDCEQISMVLDGEFEMKIGEEARTLKTGDAFYIPAGMFHRVSKIISKPCVILDCWPRGGPEIPA